jgi:hypothetical protein
MVSLAAFIRSAPPAALREYFAREGIALPTGIDWSARPAELVQPLLNVLRSAHEDRAAQFQSDAERIAGLATDEGQAAIYSAFARRDRLDVLESSAHRSLYVFLEDCVSARRRGAIYRRSSAGSHVVRMCGCREIERLPGY